MPISSARIKIMFGGCSAAWTLTAAASRQAAKTMIVMFLSFLRSYAPEDGRGSCCHVNLVGGAMGGAYWLS